MSVWVLFIQNADSLTDLFFGKKIVIRYYEIFRIIEQKEEDKNGRESDD